MRTPSILSPEDRAGCIQRKVGDYLKMGVSYIWVIDPRGREAVIYTTSGTRVVEDGIYTFAAVLCGIGFYFTILGVFELPAACLSLALFIALVVTAWVFQRDDATS